MVGSARTASPVDMDARMRLTDGIDHDAGTAPDKKHQSRARLTACYQGIQGINHNSFHIGRYFLDRGKAQDRARAKGQAG